MIIADENYFFLNTKNTSYIIRVTEDGTVEQCYYGKKIPSERMDWHNQYLFYTLEVPMEIDGGFTTRDALPQECPSFGRGDFREPAVVLCGEDGRRVSELRFARSMLHEGTVALQGLPYLDTVSGRVDTLQLVLKDVVTKAEIWLFYTVFEDCDVIARHMVVRNPSKQTLTVQRALSATLDLPGTDFESVTLHGRWANERTPNRTPLFFGKNELTSLRGANGHHGNPFMALVRPNTDENIGEVYGVTLVYSGDYKVGAQKTPLNTTRFYCGMNDENFSWTLKSGDSFTTPQALLTYSSEGLNGMSGHFHEACRKHLGACAKNPTHPVVLNLWEAFYFEINEERVIGAIRAAADTGIDTLVIDDGWFGNRNGEKESLGDWTINPEKFPNGFEKIIRECEKNNLQLGIWFDPESVNQNSELFRNHPDWAITVPGIKPAESRFQLLLDFSKPEVVDHIYGCMANILKKYPIRYVKWDFNRNMTDNGSDSLPPERQGEHSHRYMLGVYDLMGRLRKSFPKVFFEGCSGGGGRYDFGILYYMPQIWASDNSDACSRLTVQYGTSLVYPPETISAHISACPNHQTKRITPFEIRENVAQLFSLGYELDLSKMTADEKKLMKQQVEKHRELKKWLNTARFYRLADPQKGNICAWLAVSADRRVAALFFACTLVESEGFAPYIRLQGLDPKGQYIMPDLGLMTSGEVLMNAGVPIRRMDHDFQPFLWMIIQE